MLKKIKLFLLLSTLMTLGPSTLFAAKIIDGDNDVVVILTEGTTTLDNLVKPRTLPLTQLVCIYDTHACALSVRSKTKEISSVIVYNIETGEIFYDEPSSMVSFLSISGSAGLWWVAITLEDGSIYTGTFTLIN